MCPFNDHDLAAAIAHAAGGLLNMVRASPLLHGKQRGHAGDTVANAFITQLLQAQRGGDGFLSEETAPDPARLDKPRVWIIDPLDGTREYGELEQNMAIRPRVRWDCPPPGSCFPRPARRPFLPRRPGN
jgi:3'(2'), 5'-bisphosphate nucleotidase